MTAITSSTTFSWPYELILSIVDTRSNIADPRDVTGARKFVYTSDPFNKAFDFGEFPYLYLEFPVLDQVNNSADSKHHWMNYTLRLFVRTIKDGSGNSRADAGVTDMKSIVDDVVETFNNSNVKAQVRGANMANLMCDIISSDTIVANQQDIFETEFEITFNFRMQVST